ncbi:MAG: XdhC family protein [Vicinamibacteria bacterium]
MLDVLQDIERWRQEGRPIALATVVQTWGSAPRSVGAKMAMTADPQMAGSVSGGCVEAAVVEAGMEVLETGKPRLLHFGVSDETAWRVGLACGGKIEVFVKTLESESYRAIKKRLDEGRSIASVTVIEGPGAGRELVVEEGGAVVGRLPAGLEEEVISVARGALAAGLSRRSRTQETELFIDVIAPPPTLIVVGGVHIAIALTALAKTLGYRTVIVDPRGVFGSKERFPLADRLMREWPAEALQEIGLNRSTAVAALTHDPKLDDPALRSALQSTAFYVGALGSRKTQEQRRKRLLEAGLSEEQLARLCAPIGLDIGSRTPEEIALSIMAQIVAARNGKVAR